MQDEINYMFQLCKVVSYPKCKNKNYITVALHKLHFLTLNVNSNNINQKVATPVGMCKIYYKYFNSVKNKILYRKMGQFCIYNERKNCNILRT